jgi:hypothetical protein
VSKIIGEFLSGKTMAKIAEMFGVSGSNVFSVVWRETFKDVEIGDELERKLREHREQKKYWRCRQVFRSSAAKNRSSHPPISK